MAVECECLTNMDGIKHFEVYLTGVPFTVVIYHSLQFLNHMKDIVCSLFMWLLHLQPFSFTVLYLSGTDNGNADGLSQQTWIADDPKDPLPRLTAGWEGEECYGSPIHTEPKQLSQVRTSHMCEHHTLTVEHARSRMYHSILDHIHT